MKNRIKKSAKRFSAGKTFKTVCLAGLIFLAACSQRGDFSCPAQTGGGKCKTIAQSDSPPQNISPKMLEKTKVKSAAEQNRALLGAKKAEPQRSEEMIGKIWFAPHFDEEDNFYEESYVYIVVKPAKWKIKEVQ